MNKIQNERLRAYYKAEKKVLSGQSYTIGNRTFTRADLSTIRTVIDELIASGASLEGEAVPQRMSKRVVFFE